MLSVEYMREVDPVSVLKGFVAEYPTQAAAARALKIGQMYLSDMLRGNRPVSERVLRQLGLRWAVVLSEQSPR